MINNNQKKEKMVRLWSIWATAKVLAPLTKDDTQTASYSTGQ